jgi:hypothetical protein
MIAAGGGLVAVLAEGPGGCFLLPPVITDQAGRLIEGHAVLRLAWWGFAVEIPVLRACRPGQLAVVDQRLAGLRDELGAQPWPRLDPADDPGGCLLRGPIGRPHRRLAPPPGPFGWLGCGPDELA